MNTDLIQDYRYKLQKRVRRLNSIHWEHYQPALKRFWNFLNTREIFIGIIDELSQSFQEYESLKDEITEDAELLVVDTEKELVSIAYFVIQHCVESDDTDIIWRTKRKFTTPVGTKIYEDVATFHELIVEPFYEYIDEHLDDQRAILSVLRRFKHKCEWFNSQDLFSTYSNNTQVGENQLALNLYEYLYDQGLQFFIEPSSASGEIDLIAAQNTEDPLLADAKIFNPDSGKGKNYLANALNQIYIYTQNYNEPVGYLVIFKTSDRDLRLALSDVSHSTPYITYNNKTIFFVTIDIYPHQKSASKRGKLTPIEIDEDYLIDTIETDK